MPPPSDQRLAAFLCGEAGLLPAGPATTRRSELAELSALAEGDPELAELFARVAAGQRHWVSLAALRRYLLRRPAWLSPALRHELAAAQQMAAEAWLKQNGERLALGAKSAAPAAEREGLAPPPWRRLRAYAFDPSLQTRSDGVSFNEITIPVFFEPDLRPGPVGDYLEVVDVDPASGCAYAPVDLNHPWLLAQDGLERSESSPQFHQQMVYAVAMKTIGHFEEALGRPIFWSPLRPWDEASGDRDRAECEIRQGGASDLSDQFVQRLRLYPHALRAQNAYYSPAKRAILFGYFPAGDSDPATEYPGGVVFTCLSHDIIAHEMTHAILDGMHYRFTEPSNPDVYAFHEAFADIVALFQRFTYRELLEAQLARARGRLDTGSLMTQLALQFGRATGRHHALRDALGYVVRQYRRKGTGDWLDLPAEPRADGKKRLDIREAAGHFGDDELRLGWKRFRANPTLLAEVLEPHARGSFLVAAIFDAFLTIYENRIADLKRIATGGTGVLPDGALHPDLVRRMANEAMKSARHVLRICIRALDYVPPTDITFGEFLRALITADSDLVPRDERRYRVAFIESFRKWGIYPGDVRTLSEESLRWTSPERRAFKFPKELEDLRQALMLWQPGESRRGIFAKIKRAQAKLHLFLESEAGQPLLPLLGGIDTRRRFEVCNLRPARRIGPNGEFLTEMVVEVLQSKEAKASAAGASPFRGGATLIIGFEKDSYRVRYAVYKRLDSQGREARQQEYLRASGAGSGAAEYSTEGLPEGWYSDEEVRRGWQERRHVDREAIRASSCDCRRDRQLARVAINEPFALLHRR